MPGPSRASIATSRRVDDVVDPAERAQLRVHEVVGRLPLLVGVELVESVARRLVDGPDVGEPVQEPLGEVIGDAFF